MTDLLNYIKDVKFIDIKDLMRPLCVDVKEMGDLYMLNFMDEADFKNKLVRQSNGIILEKDTNNLVHYSFEKCYDSLESPSCDIFMEADLTDYTVEHFHEGSLIKVFYYNEKWRVATSKRIDASKSFWTSKRSFECLFKEAIENTHNIDYLEFLDTLDKKCSHTFLLQHPEIITTVIINEPIVFYVNKVDNETLQEERPDSKFLEVQSMNGYQNYMIYNKNPDGSITRVKLLSHLFLEMKNTLQNNKNLGLAYIDSLKTKETKFKFTQYYGNRDPQLYQKIDTLFHSTVQEIYSLYVKTHILKEKLKIPKKFEKTIKGLHYIYKTANRRVVIDDVYDIVSKLKPETIASIIKFKN